MRPIDADKIVYYESIDADTLAGTGKFYAPRELIDAMPTIEPERKKGKWIEDAETYYRAVNEKGGGVNENTPYFTDDIACSECLAKFSVIDNEAERFDFCPNCGADMRKDGD